MFKGFKSGNKAYDVLKIKDFRNFLFARFFMTFGIQMQSVIVGWQVYEYTKDPFSLGLIGLAEAVPFISIALFGGHIADIISRKKIIMISTTCYLVCAMMLFVFGLNTGYFYPLFGVLPVYLIIFVTGISRGFFFPAQTAFMAQLVPRELYANSSTWSSLLWHIAAVSGPATGGLVYGFLGMNMAYSIVVGCVMVALFFFFRTASKPIVKKLKAESLFESLSIGIKFVFKNQIILGALALDMFAVLFGGAVAMLPVFADQVFHTGPQGLGFLRAAPFFGSVIMSLYLAYNPPINNSGKKLFFAVSGFGICIILFAITTNFYLAMLLLLLSGMFDNISVVIRSTIIQLFTPDEMRGRVASVNSIFIGSSNEIGSFESGLAARIMGLVPSVIFGGAMTLVTVGSAFKLAPRLRRMNLKDEFSKKS
jgi:MFS family permease